MKNVREYLAALWKHGSGLLTGGTIGVIVIVYGLTTGNNLPQSIGLLIFGAALMIAPYLAWRYEHERAPRPLPPIDPAVRSELERLNPYQLFAVRQLLTRGGMTGEQFADQIQEWGFPIETLAQQRIIRSVFDGINEQTTLLCRGSQNVWNFRNREGVAAVLGQR